MISRRSALLTPLALAAPVAAKPAASGMTLCMHQGTSRAAGYRKSLEGWAKAGITQVELADGLIEEFLKVDTLAAAGRIVKDLGLTAVSGQAGVTELWLPGPNRARLLDSWKIRCERFATLGVPRLYSPSMTTRKITADDYKGTPDCIREAGEAAKQFNITGMIEFTRTSTHLQTLPTTLRMIREANHPNIRPMMDFFHFWSGLNKFEDLDLLQPGELAHAHFQDVADMPRELFDNNSRLIPGDGISPLTRILRKLAEKKYAGSLSVELFRPEIVNADPFTMATQIRSKAGAVLRQAKVV